MRLRYRRGEPVHVQGKQIVKYEGKLVWVQIRMDDGKKSTGTGNGKYIIGSAAAVLVIIAAAAIAIWMIFGRNGQQR